MILSNKPIKNCPYCLKDVINLGGHIANQHPSVLTQIEEKAGKNIPSTLMNAPASPPYYDENTRPNIQNMPSQSINSMLKDKIETMMNIKIMQMLEKGASLEELDRVINQPQTPQINQLQQLAEYNKIITIIRGSSVGVGEVAESSTDWGAIISGVLQVLPTLLKGRTENIKQMESVEDVQYRGDKETSNGTIKPFSVEVAGDTTEPSEFGEEPRELGSDDDDNKDGSS